MGYVIGKNYIFRTVTHYWTGRLDAVYEHELVLGDAAWIADTGRWHQCLKDGTLNEVEPIPGEGLAIISRGAIVDCCEWKHVLPREQK